MANVKASDALIIKQMLTERGADLLPACLNRLSLETQKMFLTSVATSWMPVTAEAEILQAAAEVLFPGDTHPLRRLGIEVGKIQFTGVYRVFLAITSVSFIVKRVPLIWRTMYDQGEARVENMTAKSGTFVATGLPEQQPAQREYICGVFAAVMELTGARNIQVLKEENDPQAWKWHLTWQ